jgi:hypothetical protein
MGFNISHVSGNHYSPDRVSITTGMGKKVEGVKTYTGLTAKLACWMGFAQIIKDNMNQEHVVNLRSLGKAWAPGSPATKQALTNKAKDVYASLFLNLAEGDRLQTAERRKILPGFIGELNHLFSQAKGGMAQIDLHRLRNLPIQKPHLNTFEERKFLYNRIKDALLTYTLRDITSDHDTWIKKVNLCLPDVSNMNKEYFERLVREVLNPIHLP